MISADKKYTDSINSSVRNIKSLTIMYGEGSGTYGTVFRKELKSYDIQRVGEGKFFGFGVCQRANIKLIDIDNSKTVTTSNYFKIGFDVNGSTYPYPNFYVSEVHRDEITSELSITAYDLIYKACIPRNVIAAKNAVITNSFTLFVTILYTSRLISFIK